jgi:hypothetical protein
MIATIEQVASSGLDAAQRIFPISQKEEPVVPFNVAYQWSDLPMMMPTPASEGSPGAHAEKLNDSRGSGHRQLPSLERCPAVHVKSLTSAPVVAHSSAQVNVAP